MNPLVGVTVAAYEAWNIQYATSPTSRRKDFSHDPGARESWKGSADGRTWTYTLRAGPEVVRRPAAHRRGRRLHDQPLEEGGVAQLHLGRRQPHGHGRDPTHARRQVVGRRPQAARRSTSTSCPSTSGRSRTPRRSPSTTRSTASARARSCSSTSRRASSRASRPTRTTGAASRPSTASSCASSTTPTRWSPRSSAARSTPPRTSPAPRSTSSRRTRSIVTVQGNQGAMNEFAINGGDGLEEAAPGAARPARAPGHRPRDRQEDDRRPRAAGPRHSRPTR